MTEQRLAMSLPVDDLLEAIEKGSNTILVGLLRKLLLADVDMVTALQSIAEQTNRQQEEIDKLREQVEELEPALEETEESDQSENDD